MRLNGETAYTTYIRGTTGEKFVDYLENVLLPTLEKGDVIIMDNMRSHHVKAVKDTIEKAGMILLYLPPYSPDLNPIEKMWSKIKAAMGEITEAQIRSDADRNRLVRALGTGTDRIKPAISSLYTVKDKDDTNAFLLCSDGFWQYVLESEMEDTLCRSNSPDEWLGAMKEILSSRCGNGCDNFSAIVLTE
ncbi:MAG: transposase [Oscillospiraceae bacterium]